jgi:alpha-amylase/alpha-mannosidase (GH57 family)
MALRVAFLWHMHQPYYVDPVRSVALMPWVRLHATKGYLDMIWLVEQVPEFRCTFNLTPVLVRQIQQLANGEVRDLWHELAATPAESLTATQKADLLEHFFKANPENMVKPYPRYWSLLQKRGRGKVTQAELERAAGEFSVPEYRDLQVWFNLTWFGYAAESLYPEITELKRKGRDFTEADKQTVFDRQRDVLQTVLSRYRNAAERGQIEISTTPFYHPILPLVYNTDFARRCMPGREMPPTFAHPEDARAQLALARDFHAEVFGQPPHGLWPSEGSVCPELIPILQELGFEWFATDEEVLWRSLAAGSSEKPRDRDMLFRGYRAEFGNAGANIAFRDRNLSDFIGFTACRNEPVRAAKFFMDHLREVARNARATAPLCTIILDGENAWENFADGGQRFLTELYRQLTRDEKFVTTTFHDYFSEKSSVVALKTLYTGSWINADFDIWIGSSEENRAWALLGQTRDFLQSKADRQEITHDQHEKALEEIYAAEGSDWFWWYGGDFLTENSALFDQSFRGHLENVYRILGAPVPDVLNIPIGDTQPRGVLREPSDFIQPQIDGKITSYYEWVGAGVYEPVRAMTTMYQGEQLIRAIYFGFDTATFYLRVDFRQGAEIPDGMSLSVDFLRPHAKSLIIRQLSGPDISCEIVDESHKGAQHGGTGEPVRLGFKSILELAIPLTVLDWRPDDTGVFSVCMNQGKMEIERHPAGGAIRITIPGSEIDLKSWRV